MKNYYVLQQERKRTSEMNKKYLMDLHTHTLVSGHAYNTLNEMISFASHLGLPLLGISEHAPAMLGSTNKYYFQNIGILSHEKYGVKLLYGAELNIIDYEGTTDLTPRDYRDLDYCIASLHTACITPGTKKECTHAYLTAMEHPKVMVIGHPDDGRFPVDYMEMVWQAKAHHVLIELNNTSLKPGGFRENTRENDLTILNYCMRYDTPILLGSDAHREEDIASFDRAQALLDQVHFPDELIVNTSLDLLKSYLPTP